MEQVGKKVNKVSDTWEMVKLNEVCEVVGGTTPSTTSPKYWDGDIPWLSPVDLPEVGSISYVSDSQRKITPVAIQECGLMLLPINSIVFSTRASIGKIGVVSKQLCTNQGFTNLIPSNKILPKFLAYTLKFYLPEIEKLGNSTTFKEVSRTSIRNFQIPLPPLPIQKRIAEILDAADALRRKDQELLKKYDELAQSIFIDMFGDPVRNEKGWEVRNLGEIFNSFKYGTNQKSNDDPNGIPVLRIPNVIGDKIDLGDLKYSKLDSKEYESTKLLIGDLLFVRTNGNPNYIGRSALFLNGGNFSYASYLIRARLTLPNVPFSNYLQFALSYKTYRPLILKKATTTAGNFNINTESLRSLTVPVPRQDLLDSFFQKLSFVNSLSNFITHTKSDLLFQSLLQKAFTGELVA